MNAPFKQIAEDAADKYSINVQYFEGFSQSSNIIISACRDSGISDKLKDVFRHHLSDESIEVFTKEYRELRELIDQNDETYLTRQNWSSRLRIFHVPFQFLISMCMIF